MIKFFKNILIGFMAVQLGLGLAMKVYATACANEGRDGSPNLSGMVNTYFAPTSGNASSGTSIITLGAGTGASAPISTGDMVVIIQMQDAAISVVQSNNYGSGTGTGSGTIARGARLGP